MGCDLFVEHSKSSNDDTLILNNNILLSGNNNCIDRCNSSYNISLWNRPYNDFFKFYLYINLTKLDLNGINLTSLPNDFSKLKSLQECRLSRNQLTEVPYIIKDLHCLRSIELDGNSISCLPAFLDYLPNLSLLDAYDNNITYIYCSLEHLEYLDVALNYVEPETDNYYDQKLNLRAQLNYSRNDDWKFFDDHNILEESDNEHNQVIEDCVYENWDDDEDDYWTPANTKHTRLDSALLWETFVNKEMRKGNFCPVDYHVQRVPQTKHNEYHIPGQFDDATSDEDN
ncbi:uncharacterized protein LOC143921775 [Arctopsyche grandis]|uniref:uncharacterized protein LOC143921775 n=1 Tax=Arctopsyche grandis TaxID=121162 RepID=UPI00406D8AD5